MNINKLNWKKIGLVLVLCGLCGILGWIAQKYDAFFYPPPGIIP